MAFASLRSVAAMSAWTAWLGCLELGSRGQSARHQAGPGVASGGKPGNVANTRDLATRQMGGGQYSDQSI